ncbi:hypothetical protein [Streptomyces rubellomurinus]|uniref:Uncharacterized protein n=1 Tax=Streptomyces rubellomurinus (strain ATCC 31215) TaxID=359131 RepID=A0A0F2TFM1_STRR3|nr:hypothetical protein [Streptomyces rubellomurinus]KJS60512.1 hypothetical protein VM95_20875 [Streptomyces rubellomurinus]
MFIVLVLLVAGTGLLLMGYDKLHTAVPTCFGKPMSPGDVCHARPVEVTEGMPKPQDSTYAEQLDSLTSGGWTAIGIGAVVLALAVVLAAAFTTSAIQERRDP